MKVNGLDVNIGAEGVLVEQHRASTEIGHVEPICKNVMIDILDASCRVMTCHLPAFCYAKAFSFPRRGPGFQLYILRRFCTGERLDILLCKRYA